jgi:hypothetical protein
MVVDIDDGFRGRRAQTIKEYWYRIKKYVLKRIENISLEYRFRVQRPQTVLRPTAAWCCKPSGTLYC